MCRTTSRLRCLIVVGIAIGGIPGCGETDNVDDGWESSSQREKSPASASGTDKTIRKNAGHPDGKNGADSDPGGKSELARNEDGNPVAPAARNGAKTAKQKAPEKPKPLTIADLIERAEPSVVRIDVDLGNQTVIGSGFCVSADGRVITNYHVIRDAKAAVATFNDRQKRRVTGVYYADPLRDIAVVQLESRPKNVKNLVLSANLPRKGETTIAFGAPKGLSFSTSQGIVSAVRKPGDLVTLGIKEGTWIQTTTPISKGNSGGPLINVRGEVIGANTFTHRDAQNLNLAVSSVDILRALQKAKQAKLVALTSGMIGKRPAGSGHPPVAGEPIRLPAKYDYDRLHNYKKSGGDYGTNKQGDWLAVYQLGRITVVRRAPRRASADKTKRNWIEIDLKKVTAKLYAKMVLDLANDRPNDLGGFVFSTISDKLHYHANHAAKLKVGDHVVPTSDVQYSKKRVFVVRIRGGGVQTYDYTPTNLRQLKRNRLRPIVKVLEMIQLKVSLRELVRISSPLNSSDDVAVQLGTTKFKFNRTQLIGMRDLLSQLPAGKTNSGQKLITHQAEKDPFLLRLKVEELKKREKIAAAKLRFAKLLLKRNDRAQAIRVLQEILKNFGESAAAADAGKLLKTLKK